MRNTIGSITRSLIRLIILWIVDAFSLALTARLIGGMSFAAVDTTPRWVVTLIAAGVLAVVNLVLRPIVLRLAMPLGWILTLVIGFLGQCGCALAHGLDRARL